MDTGPLVHRYLGHDREGRAVGRFLQEEERRRRFGRWYTTEPVVAAAHTLLAREEGPARAREFLHDLAAGGHPRVLAVPWREAAELLASVPAGTGAGFTFFDASVVVAARAVGTPHVLTVNGRDFRPFGLRPWP